MGPMSNRDPNCYVNLVSLLCQVFRYVRVAGGATISALASPILDLFDRLLAAEDVTDLELLMFSKQMQNIGGKLQRTERDKFDSVIMKLRQLIVLNHSKLNIASETMAGLLIVLELAKSPNWELSPDVEQFYVEQMPEGLRGNPMELEMPQHHSDITLPDMSQPPPPLYTMQSIPVIPNLPAIGPLNPQAIPIAQQLMGLNQPQPPQGAMAISQPQPAQGAMALSQPPQGAIGVIGQPQPLQGAMALNPQSSQAIGMTAPSHLHQSMGMNPQLPQTMALNLSRPVNPVAVSQKMENLHIEPFPPQSQRRSSAKCTEGQLLLQTVNEKITLKNNSSYQPRKRNSREIPHSNSDSDCSRQNHHRSNHSRSSSARKQEEMVFSTEADQPESWDVRQLDLPVPLMPPKDGKWHQPELSGGPADFPNEKGTNIWGNIKPDAKVSKGNWGDLDPTPTTSSNNGNWGNMPPNKNNDNSNWEQDN